MQEMIERIIEMDKAARRLTDEAQALRVGAEKEIEHKKREVREDYLKRAHDKIDSLREEEREAAQKEIAAFRKKTEKLKDKLNRSYQENRERWVNEIFSQITGR